MKFTGHKVCGGKAEGEALVSQGAISFFGGLNPATGELNQGDQKGKNVKDKIFVFKQSKGSTLAPYIVFGARKNGVAPKALICQEADGVAAMVAIVTGIPTLDKLDKDPLTNIKTGDKLRVDADAGTVEIL